MPIDFYIDPVLRLVVARGKGLFTEPDVLAYQQEVWSQPDLAGYSELIDMTEAEEIVAPSPAGAAMQRVAAEAAARDDPASAAKLAIVAPSLLAFGLAREYQSYREAQIQSRKQVGVFRTLAEALSFLGIDSLEHGEPGPTSRCSGSGLA
jgi:hypothetical protein